MSQNPLIEQAQQGDVNAITSLMNRLLKSQGLLANVERYGDRLDILIETDQRSLDDEIRIPKRPVLVEMIRKWFITIEVQTVSKIKVSLQKPGFDEPDWTEEIALIECEDQNISQNGGVGEQPTKSMPESNTPSSPLENSSNISQEELRKGIQVLLVIIFFPISIYLLLGKIWITLINRICYLLDTLDDYWHSKGSYKSYRSTIEPGSNRALWIAVLLPFSLPLSLIVLVPNFAYQLLRGEILFLIKLVVFLWDLLTYLIIITWFTLNYITTEIWSILDYKYDKPLPLLKTFSTNVTFEAWDVAMCCLLFILPSIYLYLLSILFAYIPLILAWDLIDKLKFFGVFIFFVYLIWSAIN